MNKFLVAAAVFIAPALLMAGDSPKRAQMRTEVTFTQIPQTVDEFVNLRNSLFAEKLSPFEGSARGAALLILAGYIYSNLDEELGLQCAVVALDRKELMKGKGPTSYKGKTLTIPNRERFRRFKALPYLMRSYFVGSEPENDYQFQTPMTLVFFSNRHSVVNCADDGQIIGYKVFVFCSGADTPRPVTMKINNRGIWKAKEFSSITVSVKDPVGEEEDDDI